MLLRAYFKSFILAQRNVFALNMHDIPASHVDKAKDFFAFCERRFEIVTVSDLLRPLPLRGRPFLLVTFDDGFVSTLKFLESELKKFRSTVFVVRDFLETNGVEMKGNLLREDAQVRYERMVSAEELKKSMQTNRLIVGCHSATHVNLSTQDDKSLEKEIITSGDELAKVVGRPIDAFAFPFGRLAHVNAKALKKMLIRYQYVFTNIRGTNTLASLQRSKIVWRQNIDLNDSLMLMKFCLLGGFDLLYRHERGQLSQMEAEQAAIELL